MWIDESKVHLAMDTRTGQICAALMTHQDLGDGQVLPDLLEQIPSETRIERIGGDGAYDTKPCHAQIAARDAMPSLPPRQGAMPWSRTTRGAAWRNAAMDDIANGGRHEWKQASGYHKRSLVENLMYRYRLKRLTGDCLWARTIGSQATEVAIRAGVWALLHKSWPAPRTGDADARVNHDTRIAYIPDFLPNACAETPSNEPSPGPPTASGTGRSTTQD